MLVRQGGCCRSPFCAPCLSPRTLCWPRTNTATRDAPWHSHVRGLRCASSSSSIIQTAKGLAAFASLAPSAFQACLMPWSCRHPRTPSRVGCSLSTTRRWRFPLSNHSLGSVRSRGACSESLQLTLIGLETTAKMSPVSGGALTSDRCCEEMSRG